MTKIRRFATASMQLIDIMNLKPEQIHLDDLAHHLAKEQRYGGSTPIDVSYSVGEHSINLANWAFRFSEKLAKVALVHDMSEAYLKDMISPVKLSLPDYLALEEYVQNIMYIKYLEYIPHTDNVIYGWDKQMLLDEVEVIFAGVPGALEVYKGEAPGLEKIGCHIEFNNHPSTTKTCFLTMCKKLGISD